MTRKSINYNIWIALKPIKRKNTYMVSKNKNVVTNKNPYKEISYAYIKKNIGVIIDSSTILRKK